MNRRGFLQSCLALAAAPAIVRADSLMRIVPRDAGFITYTAIFDGAASKLILPTLWYHADDAILDANGQIIKWPPRNIDDPCHILRAGPQGGPLILKGKP